MSSKLFGKARLVSTLTTAALLLVIILAGCKGAGLQGDKGEQGDAWTTPPDNGTDGAIVGVAGSLKGLQAFLDETDTGTFYFVGSETLGTGEELATLSIGPGQRVVVLPWNDLNSRAVKPTDPENAGITVGAGGVLTLTGGTASPANDAGLVFKEGAKLFVGTAQVASGYDVVSIVAPGNGGRHHRGGRRHADDYRQQH
jgi:hypothetical protein